MSAPKRVRVRNRGQVTSTLERYGAAYRERYPERDCRYVYDPQHKQELSGVISRQADGYEIVTMGEIGLGGPEKEGQTVRVGDLVLMSIDKEARQELIEAREQLSRDQLETVQRSFYDAQEALATEAMKEGMSKPPMKPMGSVLISEKQFEYDIDQRTGGTES